jgi:nucleotide-binding universal stress UspA family protein
MSDVASTETPLIVVGVDGSDASKDALRWAVHQSELAGAALHAIMCWRVPNTFYGGGVPGVLERDLAAESQAAFDQLVTEVLGEHGAATLTATAVEGHAAEELLKASEGAELLVVGSRGRGAFAGMLLGSISDYLVSHAPCPVVVVRHQAA